MTGNVVAWWLTLLPYSNKSPLGSAWGLSVCLHVLQRHAISEVKLPGVNVSANVSFSPDSPGCTLPITLCH